MTNAERPSEPTWQPARLAIPDLMGDIMYMSLVVCKGRIIHQYKHIDTRNYINLDIYGRAYRVKYHAKKDTYTARRTTLKAARSHLQAGWDGWTALAKEAAK